MKKIIDLVEQIAEKDGDDNRDGYFRVIEYLGSLLNQWKWEAHFDNFLKWDLLFNRESRSFLPNENSLVGADGRKTSLADTLTDSTSDSRSHTRHICQKTDDVQTEFNSNVALSNKWT